jgi:dTDP-4-dehydrorhamnose reductase
VLGSGGMAGHMVYNYLVSLNKYTIHHSALHSVTFDDAHILDVRNSDKVKIFISDIKPDIVINCIGVLIKESSDNIENAILINSYFPNFLSRLGRELNFKMIHISTDCVFSGNNGNYDENSFRDGDTVYARTKIIGEIINNRDITIRTSVVGPEIKQKGTGLLHWFLNQDGEIDGFDNVFWTGVTTLELAKAIDECIKYDITGLYNLVPERKISKYELLNLFKYVWSKQNIIIHRDPDSKSDKSLCNTRVDFDFKVKDYKIMLQELYEWMHNYRVLYKQYID